VAALALAGGAALFAGVGRHALRPAGAA